MGEAELSEAIVQYEACNFGVITVRVFSAKRRVKPQQSALAKGGAKSRVEGSAAFISRQGASNIKHAFS